MSGMAEEAYAESAPRRPHARTSVLDTLLHPIGRWYTAAELEEAGGGTEATRRVREVRAYLAKHHHPFRIETKHVDSAWRYRLVRHNPEESA